MKTRTSYFLVLTLLVSSCHSIMLLEYDNVSSFQDEYALVEKEGKYGIIDTAFQEIIAPTLDDYIGYDLSPYFFNSWLYGIRNDSLIVYDTSGTILHQYKMDGKLSPNILADQSFWIDTVNVRTSDNIYTYSGIKNWGCISITGDTIIPFRYEHIKEGLDQTIIATRGKEKSLETYLYNRKGDTLYKTYNVPIIPWKLNNTYFYFNFLTSKIETRSVDLKTIDTIYHADIVVSENYVWLKTDTLWNRYDSNLEFHDGPYRNVIQNKHWGVIWEEEKVAIINAKGEFISPFIYEGSPSDYLSNSTFIVARNSSQVHILNSKGRILKIIER